MRPESSPASLWMSSHVHGLKADEDRGPVLGMEAEDTGLFTLCLETDAGDCFWQLAQRQAWEQGIPVTAHWQPQGVTGSLRKSSSDPEQFGWPAGWQPGQLSVPLVPRSAGMAAVVWGCSCSQSPATREAVWRPSRISFLPPSLPSFLPCMPPLLVSLP